MVSIHMGGGCDDSRMWMQIGIFSSAICVTPMKVIVHRMTSVAVLSRLKQLISEIDLKQVSNSHVDMLMHWKIFTTFC